MIDQRTYQALARALASGWNVTIQGGPIGAAASKAYRVTVLAAGPNGTSQEFTSTYLIDALRDALHYTGLLTWSDHLD